MLLKTEKASLEWTANVSIVIDISLQYFFLPSFQWAF